jgi:hypothetical protein
MPATPRYATGRDPAWPTRGPVATRIAGALGVPFMPWQSAAADVTGEYHPDTGRYRYSTVVVLVPRRAGKTILTLATLLARGTDKTRRRCYYTAQDRTTAAGQYREEWVPLLAGSSLAPLLHLRLSNGSETITWTPLRSTVALFAPGPQAIHSRDADTVVIDEAWWHTDERGQAMEQGIRPAQALRTRLPQLWIVSAAGTAASSYLYSYLTRFYDSGVPADTCLIDYSADPDTDDLDDPATLERVHPAIGHTIDLATLLADRDNMKPAEWRRAYLGVRTDATTNTVPAFDGAAFTKLANPDLDTAGRPSTLAFDVAADRSTVAIVAGVWTPTGVAVELVAWWPIHAAARELTRLKRAHRARLIADRYGPTAPLVDELERSGITVDTPRTHKVIAGCAAFTDAIAAGSITHPGDDQLAAAISQATRRRVGQTWILDRVTTGDAAAVAAVLAYDAARIPPASFVVAG